MKTLLIIAIIHLFVLSHVSSQGEFIVEYNIMNNSISKVSDKIDDVTFILPGSNTYDENNSIFYFQSSAVKKHLYGVNVINGNIEVSLNAEQLRTFEFSNSLNKLFALEIDQINDTKRLVSINTENNSISNVSDVIAGSSSFQGFDSYSEKDSLFTFTNPPNLLYSIHGVSGMIKHQPELQLQANQTIQHYDYHHSTGELFALLSENVGESVALAKIDIESGIVTKIGDSHFDLHFGGSAAINANDNQYLFLYQKSGSFWLASLSLITGELIFKKEFTSENQDNLIDIEYDNKTNKLYSKHWDSQISNLTILRGETIAIFPNPTRSNIIEISNLPVNAEGYGYKIYNNAGKEVCLGKLINSSQIELTNIHKGIYFIKIFTPKQTVYSSKLIVGKIY